MSETRRQPQRIASNVPHNGDDLFYGDLGTDSGATNVRPPTKKVRKTRNDAHVGPGLTGRRKHLSRILYMPLDVLYEVDLFRKAFACAENFPQIFSALHPSDILSLSRTSRLLRETLKVSNARGVWRSAMDRDGVPRCPLDWTEPRWAALLYDHNCQVTPVSVLCGR